jgi:cytochrome c oxidase assembly protein subunit 15
MSRALRWLAIAASLGMFLVLVMGAAVTNTGSAEGCGRSWPLCNGQFIPEFTVSTAIEYSHRAVTGVEGMLVVALTACMLWRWRRDREVVVLALLMLGTLLLQAGLGAGAVLVPQSPFMLATHFGVSLVAVAATFLSGVLVFERTRGIPSVPRPLPGHLRRWVLGVAAYVMVVVYLGAYIRHAGVSLACADWPLCNGQVVPSMDGPTGFVFAHRLAAIGALLLLAWLLRLARTAHVGQVAAGVGLGLCTLQALSGALVVWTRLGLFSTLAHAAVMALLFAALAHLVRLAFVSPERNDFVADGYPLSDEAARHLQPSSPEETAQQHVLATTTSGIAPAGGGGAVADDSRGQRASSRPAGRRATSTDERA